MSAQPRPVARRAVLLGATAALAAGCGAADSSPHLSRGRRLITGSFTSSRMGGVRTRYVVAHPPGQEPGDRLPVVVSLHGRGASARTAFSSLRLDRALDRVVRSGVPPFAVVSVDGGDHGYWHPRSDGTDAAAMVAGELLPLLADRGLDTGRLGLHGWSMGGFGALLIAGKGWLRPRAVAVSSPALFRSAGATSEGAFDGPEDFARHDVFGHPGWLGDLPAWIDCGRSDPFYAATRDFVARLQSAPQSAFPPGAHTPAHWRAMAEPALRFLGARLGG